MNKYVHALAGAYSATHIHTSWSSYLYINCVEQHKMQGRSKSKIMRGGGRSHKRKVSGGKAYRKFQVSPPIFLWGASLFSLSLRFMMNLCVIFVNVRWSLFDVNSITYRPAVMQQQLFNVTQLSILKCCRIPFSA